MTKTETKAEIEKLTARFDEIHAVLLKTLGPVGYGRSILLSEFPGGELGDLVKRYFLEADAARDEIATLKVSLDAPVSKTFFR